MRKARLLVVAAGLVASATVGVGTAQARLDPTFGQGGVVEVRPPLSPPWRDQFVRSMSAARNGDSFVLAQRLDCTGSGPCLSAHVLFRYLRDGTLDSLFGGPNGFYELPPEGGEIQSLAVDSAGRPLLAQVTAHHVVIRRLTPSGVPDSSFGAEGAVGFECLCQAGQAQLAPGPRGSVTVVLPRARYGIGRRGVRERTGTIFTLVRLRSDGSRDRRFHGGTSTFGLRGTEPPLHSATARSGALYLGGVGCCGSGLPGYVIRISARGRVDGRFTAASQRSLRAVRPLGSLESSVNAVLVRAGGKIDLLGSAGYGKGFVLRLEPNGTPHRRFAASGWRILPLPVASAALGTDGATLAVSDEGLREFDALMRILRNGRLDPAFGAKGQKIPDSEGDSGISVVAQTGGKALVLDRGLKECRTFCQSDPKLVRFLEGRSKRR